MLGGLVLSANHTQRNVVVEQGLLDADSVVGC